MSEKKPRKPGSGGARPGAGRPRKYEGGIAKQVTLTLTPEQYQEFRALRDRGIDTNKALGREIHRLAVAHDLADLGIV